MIRISFWTAVFLVVLRVCIGWHFAYEGYTKVNSAYAGKAAGEKVFTSESYFRESEGPFGKLVKSRIGDPDQEIVDKLTLKPVGGDVSDASPASRFPEALAKEWDDYFGRFVKEFRLDEQQKSKAQTTFDQWKAKVVLWIEGNSDEPKDKKSGEPKRIVLKVKRKAPGVANQSADFEQEVTVAERAAELKKKSEEVKDAYKTMMDMGKDVDAAVLRAKKVDANAIRAELQKELDEQTKKMKDDLAKVLDPRVTAYAKQIDNKEPAPTLEAMLTPMAEGKNPLATMWDQYSAFVKDFSPGITDAQKSEVDEEVRSAKTRFDRWLADKDQYTGKDRNEKPVAEWRTLYAAAKEKYTSVKEKKEKGPQDKDAEDEYQLLIKQMQAELKTQSDAMRAQVGTPLLGEDRAKGHAPPPDDRFLWLFPKEWTLIEYIDWSTRWFLLIVGILLMVGLFTRFSCFAAAGFLLLTILTQPSVPWLPAAPMNEGSYLFINKNVIEMVALLALMTTRSGRWAGLDGIVCAIFGRRNRNNEL
jgi:uncharacterized membrane protein YphA (DoxX/SURF4 family)